MTESVRRLHGSSRFEDIAGYCRAVRAGHSIAVSATAAAAADGQTLESLDTYAQTSSALAIALEAAQQLGAPAESVVRTRLYLSPEAVWEDAARAHGDLFTANRPANTTVFVAALIPPGALVEAELDAFVAESA